MVLGTHNDYATALAAAPAANMIASAGLGKQVLLWDVAMATKLHAKGSVGYLPLPVDGIRESSYALALQEQGTMLAVGTACGIIRVADPRTGSKVMKLRGHTDNVRALLLHRCVGGCVCVCVNVNVCECGCERVSQILSHPPAVQQWHPLAVSGVRSHHSTVGLGPTAMRAQLCGAHRQCMVLGGQ